MNSKSFCKGLLILTLSFVICGCQKHTRRKIDITGVSMNTNIQRFDVDFWSMNPRNIAKALEELDKKYPVLLPLYTSQGLCLGDWRDKECQTILAETFFTDTIIDRLYTDCLKTFEDISVIDKELSDGMKRAHEIFPEKTIPQVCFHVSAGAYPYPLIYKDSLISIGIDNYLGENYPLYGDVYGYLRYNMRPEKVVPDIMTVWITNNFRFVPQTGQLLEEMLYRGKIMYLLSVLLPEETDANLIGYTKEQWQWCMKEEPNMWMEMVEQKHLFSTNGLLANKYLNDAPFTQYFSQDSPGRCGVFVGWRIIDSYMQHNSDVSIATLMKDNDYKNILEKSRYRP